MVRWPVSYGILCTSVPSYYTEIGHWLEKSVKFITRLLKNAESNADAKSLELEDLYIKNIGIQQAPLVSGEEVERSKDKDKDAAGVSSLSSLNQRQVARRRIEAACA
ncbi:hypothetical protein EV702DRAFT_1139037 [Suillus placidus]|uniref:Uncharacterized protein n=1 Tax=Suillus placidus TaxID=48579 RepID=A0A9P7CYZ1_9AGAM|nr:hypothetical protein EV702DRAFT_1139037 [Suillus placidus]